MTLKYFVWLGKILSPSIFSFSDECVTSYSAVPCDVHDLSYPILATVLDMTSSNSRFSRGPLLKFPFNPNSFEPALFHHHCKSEFSLPPN